ncbi:hypothetical protein HU200_003396 [Digitaria exilis]|uniref:Uncharacterized protein n=1 Tax=Digitaria exilis TaxID=1010633 RepID=A0A835FY56_9POAL|nr:hypothetical protein HU200_003396 [Digitaria exilis]
MPVRAPLPVLLLGATVALLLAVSAIGTPAAAANNYGGGGGRMVIIRAPPPGTTTRTSAAAGGRNRWQQWRRVEDEVAPEFAGLLGAVGSTVASSLNCSFNMGGVVSHRHPPLAVLLLVALLLLATSASSAHTSAAVSSYAHGGGGGGRMVIVRAPGGGGGASSSSSRYYNERRLVEDEVAPEFAAGLLLGAGDDYVSSKALKANEASCIHNCGAKWRSYVRPCDNIYQSQGCSTS